MPTIHISITDEDVERIAKRFAIKLAEALNEPRTPKPAQPAPQQTPPKTPPAEWLTTSDICRMFQITRTTVWRWANEQGMPCRRVGGVVRFPAAKILEWAEKQSITAPASDGTAGRHRWWQATTRPTVYRSTPCINVEIVTPSASARRAMLSRLGLRMPRSIPLM